MKAKDLMTWNPVVATPGTRIRRVAAIMRDVGVGAIPVVNDVFQMRACGIITDRDVATRCVAAGHDPDCAVSEHMSLHLVVAGRETELDEVRALMTREHVRRVVVLGEHRRVIGIISESDLAATPATAAFHPPSA